MSDGISPIQIKLDAKPLADLGNNIVNKLAQAIGWIASPRGDKKDLEEARNYFVQEVEKKSDIPPTAKALLISNAYKAVKEYQNQNDIFHFAAEQLDEKAQPEQVDNDWLSHFFEEAKHVSQDDVKIIWGKLLANECNSPGSVTKSLIRTLSEMSIQDAKAFEILSSFVIKLAGEIKIGIPNNSEPVTVKLAPNEDVFIDYRQLEYYQSKGLGFQQINELENKRLISFNSIANYSLMVKSATFYYYGKRFRVEDIKSVFPAKPSITLGNVILTEDGKSLYKAIQHTEQPDFVDVCKAAWLKAGLQVTQISEKSEEKK